MDAWLQLTEESWEELLNQTDESGLWNTMVSIAVYNQIEGNLKLTVIYELFFRAISHCIDCAFNYNKAKVLLNLIAYELEHISSQKARNPLAESSEAIAKAAMERFVRHVNEHKSDEITNDTCKKITTFYCENMLRSADSYAYVMQDIYREELDKRMLDVQTPLVPMPLASANETTTA